MEEGQGCHCRSYQPHRTPLLIFQIIIIMIFVIDNINDHRHHQHQDCQKAEKMTGETPDVRSDKNLTLLTFDI